MKRAGTTPFLPVSTEQVTLETRRYFLLKQTKNSAFKFPLSKQQRLCSPAEFQEVYKSKQWGGSSHHTFNVLAQLVENQPTTRFGVTVSKKVSKLAVRRNRIKRQVREFYRLHQADLIPVDLVITAKPSCDKASDAERLESLELLWKKILKWQRWFIHNRPDN